MCVCVCDIVRTCVHVQPELSAPVYVYARCECFGWEEVCTCLVWAAFPACEAGFHTVFLRLTDVLLVKLFIRTLSYRYAAIKRTFRRVCVFNMSSAVFFTRDPADGGRQIEDTRRTEREKQTSGPTEQRDGKTMQYVAMVMVTSSIKITVYSINYCALFNGTFIVMSVAVRLVGFP